MDKIKDLKNSIVKTVTGKDAGYHHNLLGESLPDLLRKATAKTLLAPDEPVNQQVRPRGALVAFVWARGGVFALAGTGESGRKPGGVLLPVLRAVVVARAGRALPLRRGARSFAPAGDRARCHGHRVEQGQRLAAAAGRRAREEASRWSHWRELLSLRSVWDEGIPFIKQRSERSTRRRGAALPTLCRLAQVVDTIQQEAAAGKDTKVRAAVLSRSSGMLTASFGFAPMPHAPDDSGFPMAAAGDCEPAQEAAAHRQPAEAMARRHPGRQGAPPPPVRGAHSTQRPLARRRDVGTSWPCAAAPNVRR